MPIHPGGDVLVLSPEYELLVELVQASSLQPLPDSSGELLKIHYLRHRGLVLVAGSSVSVTDLGRHVVAASPKFLGNFAVVISRSDLGRAELIERSALSDDKSGTPAFR